MVLTVRKRKDYNKKSDLVNKITKTMKENMLETR